MMSNFYTVFSSAHDQVAREKAAEALDYSLSHDATIASLGTAASANVGLSAGDVLRLDNNACLPAVDGSQLFNLPTGTAADTSETDIAAGGGQGYLAWDAARGAFLVTSGPAVANPTNFLYAADAFVQLDSSTMGVTTSVLGLTGRVLNYDVASWHKFEIGGLTAEPANPGDFVDVAFAFDATGVDASRDYVRIYLNNGGYIDFHFRGGSAGWVTPGGTWGKGYEPADSTVDGVNNYVTSDLGTKEYIAKFRLVRAIEPLSVADNNALFFNCNAVGSTVVVAPIVAQVNAAYAHDAGDDTAKVQPPGSAAPPEFPLTSATNQKIAVDTALSSLTLPPAPSSGVRDIMLRVLMTAPGSLILPDTGVTVFGLDGDTLSVSARLAIRQYGDGSSADIYVVAEPTS